MSEKIIIKKEDDFYNEKIKLDNIENDSNIKINLDNKENDNKGILYNNIKPMLNNNKTEKVKIKSKKIPIDTFNMFANNRLNDTDSNVNSDDDQSISSFSDDENEIENEVSDNLSEISDNNINEEVDDDDESGTIQTSNSGDTESEYDDESDTDTKKPRTYEDIQRDKQLILFKLDRLSKQGYNASKKYSMASSWEDMNFEYERLKKQRDVERSIKFCRKILLAIVSGIEYLNNRFDPLDIKLDGWSENMMENINDYDETFEELYDKHHTSINMAPELKLIAMVAGSGFMFHLTNSLFKTATPSMNDILRQNPDIMKNITETAIKNMQTNINTNMGSNDPIGNMVLNGINKKMDNDKKIDNDKNELDDLLNDLNDKSKKNKKSGIRLSI